MVARGVIVDGETYEVMSVYGDWKIEGIYRRKGYYTDGGNCHVIYVSSCKRWGEELVILHDVNANRQSG